MAQNNDRACRERLVPTVARSFSTSQQTSPSQYVDRASQPRIQNKNGKHCDQDVRAFGMAYKHSNDISKHGGRVPLPSHLRDTIVQKRKELNDFIQDADDLIGK
jgi:hypothetical protein